MTEQTAIDELEQYSKTFGVYDHIISLQKFMANVSQVYLGINAAVWVTVLSEKIALTTVENNLLLALLIFSAIWLVWLFIGISGAVQLRFDLLEDIGKKYFPDIKAMGESSYREAYTGFYSLGKASWANSRWFWFIVPLIGLVVNLWLLLRVNCC